MTGYYVRIERAGKWGNVEIDRLTDEELEQFMTPENGRTWAIALAKWIRDNIQECNPEVTLD